MKSEIGNRGKVAEKEVKVFLERINRERTYFDYERLPDSRSSKGRVAAQVADYAFFMPRHHGVIEVKETEHEFRLPRAKLTQLPKMRKRHLAGGECIVIVYHSTIDKWRVPDFQWVMVNEAPSWDLSQFPTFHNAEDALRSFETFAARVQA